VLYTNWDGNWKHHADRPGGASFECELVGFQTAYSALVPGDYEKCVSNFYGSHANWPVIRVVDKIDLPTEPTDPNGWKVNAVYNTGDRVVVNGVTYEAKSWTQGDDPEQSGAWGPWKIV
jgi:hypothetical protein